MILFKEKKMEKVLEFIKSFSKKMVLTVFIVVIASYFQCVDKFDANFANFLIQFGGLVMAGFTAQDVSKEIRKGKKILKETSNDYN